MDSFNSDAGKFHLQEQSVYANKPCCRTLCVVRTTLRVLLVCYVRYARFPQMLRACVSLCLWSAPKGGSTRKACWLFFEENSRNPPDTQTKKHILRCAFLLVERGGFEPPKSLTTDLQSAPFGHSGTSPYGAGDRNRTNNLLITNQLLCLLSYTSVFSCWCLGADSNHRHRDFQSLALPPELPRHI